MDRRDFIRSAGRTCAALALLPAAVTLESCAGGKSLPLVNNAVHVPKSMLDPNGTAIVSAKGVSGKLMVTRRPDGTYSALSLSCPHMGGAVKEKDGMLKCPWHGSTFDLDGALTKGPAKTGLTKYTVEEAGEELRVLVA